MVLPNCPIILLIKAAHDNRHLIVIGVTKDYKQVLMLLDWRI